MRDKRLFRVSLLIGMAAAGLALVSCKDKEPEVTNPHLARQLRVARGIAGQSISLRNGLESFVEYTVKPAGVLEPPEPRILDTGEIDTYTEGEKITVTFARLYSVARQDLEPGKTYSFVRDETGEVVIEKGWHGLRRQFAFLDAAENLFASFDGQVHCDLSALAVSAVAILAENVEGQFAFGSFGLAGKQRLSGDGPRLGQFHHEHSLVFQEHLLNQSGVGRLEVIVSVG